MVEILDLHNAIATKLHKLTGHPCYYDYVEQNAVYPCFFIRLVDSEQTPDLDRRYLREHNFEILFFPSESGEIQDVNILKERDPEEKMQTLKTNGGIADGN